MSLLPVASKIVPMLLCLGLASPSLAATFRDRQERQQQRIGQGIRSGELTPREAARLERGEARINREFRRDRADGKFSRSERARMRRHQHHLSRRIFREKHNRQVR